MYMHNYTFNTGSRDDYLGVRGAGVFVEGAVQLPEPAADVHLPLPAHHALLPEHQQTVLAHILLDRGHGFWGHALPEIDPRYFHSAEREGADGVWTRRTHHSSIFQSSTYLRQRSTHTRS